MKTTHLVTVLGREISVRSSATPEKVRQVEEFVSQRLQEIGAALKSGDAQLVLTLALLNTADELLESQRSNEAESQVDHQLQSLIDKLEQV